MKMKPDVQPRGLTPEMLLGIIIAERVYEANGVELVITSLNDSVHSLTSLHYSGNAVDLRTRNIPEVIGVGKVAKELRAALPVHYDVVVEKDHIHLEYQPRRI